METPYEKKFGKVEPVDKKQHKRGWWRSAYFIGQDGNMNHKMIIQKKKMLIENRY